MFKMRCYHTQIDYITNLSICESVFLLYKAFKASEIMDYGVDFSSIFQPFAGRGPIDRNDPASTGIDGCLNAGGRILDNGTIPGRQADSVRGLDIKCRVGLAGQFSLLIDNPVNRKPPFKAQIFQIKIDIFSDRRSSQSKGDFPFGQQIQHFGYAVDQAKVGRV